MLGFIAVVSFASVAISAEFEKSEIPQCAFQLINALECVERLKSDEDLQMLEMQRIEIYYRCVTHIPEECKIRRQMQDNCEHDLLKDKFQTLRNETESNITQCFENYPIKNQQSQMTGAAPTEDESAEQLWSLIMTSKSHPNMSLAEAISGPRSEQCTPTLEQVECIERDAAALDKEAVQIVNRIQSIRRNCLAASQLVTLCRFDNNPELRDCIVETQQMYTEHVAIAIEACVENLGKMKSDEEYGEEMSEEAV